MKPKVFFDETMDIYTKKGKVVRFLGRNGSERTLEDALKFLIPSAEYTILHTEVHNFHTDVVLREFPDKRFNSVMFANVLPVKGKKGGKGVVPNQKT